MGRDLFNERAVCRHTFEEADQALGFSISRLCFEGPESELTLTAIAQPAILTVSVAVLRALAEDGLEPDVVAGHSLGEYAALVAAGSLQFRDAVVLVNKRGKYMQEAVPVGHGAMVAIMGLDRRVLEEACRQAAEDEVVSPANFNAPGQTVVSGHAAAVSRAMAAAKDRGASRAVQLQVSAPFHCSLMEPAAVRLAADLDAADFQDLEIPLVANVDAKALSSGAEARAALKRQITAPVLWEESMRAIAGMGVTRAVEVGPAKVLTGLLRRIVPDIECTPAGGSAAMSALKESVS